MFHYVSLLLSVLTYQPYCFCAFRYNLNRSCEQLYGTSTDNQVTYQQTVNSGSIIFTQEAVADQVFVLMFHHH